MLKATKTYHVVSKQGNDLSIITYSVSEDTRYWAKACTSPRIGRDLAHDERIDLLKKSILYIAKQKGLNPSHTEIYPSVEFYLTKFDDKNDNALIVNIQEEGRGKMDIIQKRAELKFLENGEEVNISLDDITSKYFIRINSLLNALQGDIIVLENGLFEKKLIEKYFDNNVITDDAEDIIDYLEAMTSKGEVYTSQPFVSKKELKQKLAHQLELNTKLTSEKEHLTLEKGKSEGEKKLLSEQLEKAQKEPKADSHLIEENEILIYGIQKAKKQRTMAFILASLIAMAAIGFYFMKPSAIKGTENPLLKRINSLVENRIYPKQQQLVSDSKGVIPGSNEVLEILKVQENLNKALFDIHKVKFELIPQLEAKKISANEVEKEIIKIENEIK